MRRGIYGLNMAIFGQGMEINTKLFIFVELEQIIGGSQVTTDAIGERA